MGYLIGIIIWGTIWGFVTKKVIENKGYEENWFWWGFFFGFIALIVACTKPQKYNYPINNNINDGQQATITPSYETVVQNSSNRIPEEVDVNSVIDIKEYEILRGSNGSILLKIRMKNIGNQNIKALKLHISGKNSFMEKISFGSKEYFEVLIQDLNFATGVEITHQIELAGEQKEARHFEFWVSQICFSNDSIINCEQPFYVQTCQEPVDLKYLSYLKSTCKMANYYMIEYPKAWQCICGYVNIGDKCSNCGLMIHNAVKFRKDTIEKNYIEYKRLKDEEECRRKEEERRIAQEKETERIKQSKIKRIRKTILILLVVIVSALVGYNKVYLPAKQAEFYSKSEEYIKGMQWYEEGIYLQALNNFEKIGYTGEEYLESCYQYGLECKEMGDSWNDSALSKANYERAIIYFEKAMKYNYKDSSKLFEEMEKQIEKLK